MASWRAVVLLILLIFCIPDTTNAKLVEDFFKTKGLKLLHLNVRGLLSNFTNLQKFIHDNKSIDIFAVTETHINDNSEEKLFIITNYSFIAKSRSTGKGGGVGIYVKNNLEFERRTDLEGKTCECIWIEIFIKHSKSLLIACYYRPPNSSKHLSKNFTIEFNESLITAQKEQKEVIILGDFNVNYMSEGDNKDIKSIIDINGFEQIVNEPTRVTTASQTLIDLILTNYSDNIKSKIVLPLSIGDHDVIGCVRKLNSRKHISKTTVSRDYRNYDPKNLVADLRNINWESLYSCFDVDIAANIFTETLKGLFDKHAPFKTKVVKGKPAPWLKIDLRLLMDQRDRALRKSRKTKTENDLRAYKNLRNECNKKLKEAKRKYHRNLISESQGNAKQFWDAIKKVFPSNSNCKSPTKDKVEQVKTANMLSSYFANAVRNIKSKFTTLKNLVWRQHLVDRKTDKVFKFSYISNIFVKRRLEKLKRNKSTGLDELPPGMIKDCARELSQPLAFICNLSINSGKMPSVWKRAKVIPIHKGGDSTPENYRPISILPIFSKIIESSIKTQLLAFLETNNIFTDSQFGYRQQRSTKLASTYLFDDIRKCIDQGEMVGAVFIDLTKAFDTISHGLLLKKLQEYGINGIELDWFSSYLFNREQIVCLEQSFSKTEKITSGVPQGSILGPLMFLIFFNDFPICLNRCKTVMYADDTVVYVSSKVKSNIEDMLDCELVNISRYFAENELFINLKKGKTESMILGTSKRIREAGSVLNVNFNGQPISNVSQYKYLGNIIDQNLNFSKNFERVYKKASGRLKLLKRLRYFLTMKAAYDVYSMMIVPLLTYRGSVKLTYTKTQQNKFGYLERRAREIIGQPVPKIINVIKKEAIMIVKRSLEKKICKNFENYFEIKSHGIATRNNGYLITLPKFKLELGKQSFKYAGAKLFNDLPLEIRSAKSFEKSLMEYFNRNITS